MGTVVYQLAQAAVGGDAAGQHDLLGTGIGGSGEQLLGQDLVDALLEAGGHVGHIDRLAFLLGVVHLVDDGGFQAAEADVVLALHMRHRQPVGVGVAVACGSGHTGATGVRQAQRAGYLVVGFARSIVDRAAQDRIAAPVLDHYNVAMPAAGHQAEERRMQILVGQIVGGDVPAQMMHRHQRFACRVGQPLGKVDAYQHRADQPRRKGHGHGIHVFHGHVGIGQGFVHGGTDILGMATAGDLRHNAAV